MNCPVTTAGPFCTLEAAQTPRLQENPSFIRAVLKAQHGFLVAFIDDKSTLDEMAREIYRQCGREMVSCENEAGEWQPYQLELESEK